MNLPHWQHEIDAISGFGQRLGGGPGFENVVTFGLEPIGQRPANQLLVVDDENRWSRHGWQIS